MTYSVLQQAAETRRSIYALNNTLPLSNEEVTKIIEHAVLHTPSAFNSQSARVVVLFGEEHAKVWHFVEEALRAIVPAEQFEATAQKLNLFKAGAATVLFFEDQDVSKVARAVPILCGQLSDLGGSGKCHGSICCLDNIGGCRYWRQSATLQPAA